MPRSLGGPSGPCGRGWQVLFGSGLASAGHRRARARLLVPLVPLLSLAGVLSPAPAQAQGGVVGGVVGGVGAPGGSRVTVSSPASPGRSRAPAWGIAADPGLRTTCALDGAPASPCGPTWTADLSRAADGDHHVVVRARDAKDHVQRWTGTYRLDTTAPATPLVVASGRAPDGSAVTWAWPAGSRAASDCVLLSGDVRVRLDGCHSGTPVSLPSSGTWRLSVVVTDPAGNASAPGTSAPEAHAAAPTPTAPVPPVPPVPSAPVAPPTTAPTAPPPAPSAGGPAAPLPPMTGPAALPARVLSPPAVQPAPPVPVQRAPRVEGEPPSPALLAPVQVPASTPGAPVGLCTLDPSPLLRRPGFTCNSAALGTGVPVLAGGVAALPPADVRVVTPTGHERQADFTVGIPTQPDGLVASCALSDPDGPVSDTSACAGATSYTLGSLPDGPYTLTVVLHDGAGGSSPAAQATYVLDTAAPLAPAVVPSASGGRVAWSWVAEPAVGYRCRLSNGTAVLLDAVDCRPGVLTDLSAGPAGTWAFVLTATDPAGNTATTTASWQTGAEGAQPDVTAPLPTSGAAPVWGLPDEGGLTCTLLRDDVVVRPQQPCRASWTTELSGEPEATYVLQVAAAGATTASAYRYDLTPPVVRVSPDRLATSSRTPLVLLFTDDPTATVTCRLDDVPLPGPCTASTTGAPLTLDLSGQLDGAHVLAVTATDAADNSARTLAGLDLDTVAPPAPQVTGPASPGASAYPVWELPVFEDGTSLTCSLTTPSGALRAAACTSGRFTTGPLDEEGDWTLSVTAVDAAGNTGPATTSVYAYDRTAPATAEVTAQQGPGGSRRAASWTWAAATGTTSACTVLRGEQTTSPWAPCTSPYALVLTPSAPDGLYRLLVRAVDRAGNTGLAREGSYLLDSLPPVSPVFISTPASPSSAAAVSWVLEGPVDGTLECVLRRDGAPVGQPTGCAAGSSADLAAAGLGEGTYVLRAVAVDAVGNRSLPVDSPAYDFRRGAPGQVHWTAGPLGVVARVAADWGFTTDPGTGALCRVLRDRAVVRALAPCSGSVPARDLSGAGSYTLQVFVVAGGHRSAVPAARSFTLLADPPPVPTLSTRLPGTASSPTATWSWLAPAGDRLECRLVLVGEPLPAWEDCTARGGTYATQLPREGTWEFQGRAVDRAGRASPVAVSPDYRYDRTPPPAPLLSGPLSGRGPQAAVRWTFPVPAQVTARCSVTFDAAVLVRQRDCSGSYQLDLAGRPDGRYELTVVLRDEAGNQAQASAAFTLLPAPVVFRAAQAPAPARPAAPPPEPAGPRPGPRRPVPVSAVGPLLPTRPGAPYSVPAVRPAGRPAAPALPAQAADGSGRAHGLVPGVPGALDTAIRRTLTETVRTPTIPVALVLLVVGFLLLQNRIDRRDPKLAAAPVEAEPDVEFGPAVGPSLREADR